MENTPPQLLPTEKKFDIQRSIPEKLKMYFLLLKEKGLMPVAGDNIRGILAYRPEDASAFQRSLPETGDRGIFWLGDFAYVETILAKVNAGDIVIPIAPEAVQLQGSAESATEEEKNVMTFETFRASLLMASEEYALPEDKEALRGILGRLKAPTRPTEQRGEPDKGVNNEKQPA